MNMIPPDLMPEEDIELENGFEWVDGHAVEKAIGFESSHVGGHLFALLKVFLTTNPIGFAVPGDVGYRIGVGSTRRVRKPDVSFVARGRVPDDRMPSGDAAIAPALAVGVISPNDMAEDIEQRVADYFSVGTRLFWILDPATHTIWVLRRDGSAPRLTEQQTLAGEDVIPGFSCHTAPLFAGLGPTPETGS